MKSLGSIALSGWWIAVAAAPAFSQDAERSIQAGVYTKEQAENGRRIFTEICEACHHTEEFSEGGYLEGWSGQKVSDFVGLVRSTMPQDSPGRLKRSEYIEIAAFIFELNGVPAGETEMDSQSVNALRIEGPFDK